MSIPLLIPIENQVRELDPKLLLATCAAKSGISSYIGYRTEMDIKISSFPRSIYLAKSFTHRSDKMFRILTKLGHTICAWDEEALVHYPADIYFKRRLSPVALSYVSHLFAWGQDNEDLFKSYPLMPNNIAIHKIGNPRLDMLRKEFSYYFDDEVAEIKRKHGQFILINTNFGNVNAYLPVHNLFLSKDQHGNYQQMGRGATGMGREFSQGRAKYKEIIFEKFKTLIPYLAENISDSKIVIRPHPVEHKQCYYDIANKYNNVEVVQQGNVVPWIRASTALIHNGCTTGIEAYLSNKPAIAYIPIVDNRHGYCAKLPNNISHQCYTPEEVMFSINQHLQGSSPDINSDAINHFIKFEENTLCCSNMVSILKNIIAQEQLKPSITLQLHGKILADKRKFIKRIKGLSAKSKYHQNFQQQRFPCLEVDNLQKKINKFAQIIGSPEPIRIKQVSPHIFLVQ